MKFIEQGIKLIRDCEGAIQRLLAEAAAMGEYDTVILLTSWAKHLAQISTDEGGSLSPIVTCSLTKEEKTGTRYCDPSTTPSPYKTKGSQTTQAMTRRSRRLVKTSKKTGASDAYPIFFKQGNDIVKLGWSKKERKEYLHKSPKRYLELIASIIDGAGKNGALFSTEHVLPVHDPDSGGEVPGYQAYLCIALLRQKGLVQQHGRQGYTVPQGTLLMSQIPSIWESLQER
jgi:hypothetical protein